MKGFCIANTGESVVEKRVISGQTSVNMSFPIVLQKEYEIFGIIFDNDGLSDFLICDETSLPVWIPAELIRLTDTSIPVGWHFSNQSGSFIPLKIGYEHLVCDQIHFDGLIEGQEEELKEFFRLREEWKKRHER